MAVYVSHFLVDWDRFCARWAEEEHPLDALDGARRESTRDDTYSSVLGCQEAYAKYVRKATLREWSAALDVVAAAVFNQGGPNAIRDLADDFAHETGGFAATMQPARVGYVVSQWEALPLESVQTVLASVMGDGDARFLMDLLASRAALLIKAAAAGQGYVTRLG